MAFVGIAVHVDMSPHIITMSCTRDHALVEIHQYLAAWNCRNPVRKSEQTGDVPEDVWKLYEYSDNILGRKILVERVTLLEVKDQYAEFLNEEDISGSFYDATDGDEIQEIPPPPDEQTYQQDFPKLTDQQFRNQEFPKLTNILETLGSPPPMPKKHFWNKRQLM